MPTIPVINQSINPDVPSAPQAYAGGSASSMALANLGSQVSQAGIGLLNQVRHIEDTNSAQQKYLQTQYDAEDKYTQLKLEHPDGYVYQKNPDGSVRTDGSGNGVKVLRPDLKGYRTITDEYHDWANDRYNQDQSSLPSANSQLIYKSQAAPF